MKNASRPVAHSHKQQTLSHPVTRRDFLSTGLKAGAAAFTTGLLPRLKVEAAGQYNVLFIIVDDLRPLLGCYGHPEMHTPNIDALAQRGTLFNRAYCQFPVCNPSRASILTGLRPDTTRVLDNFADFRQTVPSAVTLPQYFKSHGYHTRSVGKIDHGLRALKDESSWSTPIWWPRWRPYEGTPSWQALDVADDELSDGETAKQAVEVLEEIKDSAFFLAVGFYKPHMPFNAPTRYYELYDIETLKDAPHVAPPAGHEIRVYSDIPAGNTPLSKEKTLELIRAYAASTSYMDAQVGRVLAQLDRLGLTEKTVIAFCGDHGYHLGEHGTWGKRTVFEVALRSPLILSIPGHAHPGTKTNALVELVDIYPTLCDTCQLPIPSELEGISMVPVIEQPTRPWKTAAFSQIGKALGKRSMRTEQYRYTEWGINASLGKELYDYQADPEETVNIAHHPENNNLVAHLSEQLRAGWKGAFAENQEQVPGPQTLPWDVNNDGVVDIRDLVLVSSNFGAETLAYPKVDANQDGTVDIFDLLIVASHFGETVNSAAPPQATRLQPQHVDSVAEWLAEARTVADGSTAFRKGIAALEQLLNTTVPTVTSLLPNYPNPFNPETWIPYDLAEDAEVSIHIWTLKGESVRRLSVGFQTAGIYRSRERAAYWDGRNAAGELVASGVYFYTLHAGGVKATRQLVILK